MPISSWIINLDVIAEESYLVCIVVQALWYALHITEEDVNTLSVYRKDWWLDKVLFI